MLLKDLNIYYQSKLCLLAAQTVEFFHVQIGVEYLVAAADYREVATEFIGASYFVEANPTNNIHYYLWHIEDRFLPPQFLPDHYVCLIVNNAFVVCVYF